MPASKLTVGSATAAMAFDVILYVINLDRSPERWEAMHRQLDPLGLPFERFPAIDGRNLGPPERPEVDLGRYRQRHGKTPSPGEIGCFLSHLAVHRHFLASRFQYAIVLEDDVILAPEFPAVVAACLARTEQWDMVKLEGSHHGAPLTLDRITATHRLVVYLTHQAQSGAYLLNRRAASRYVERLLPMTVPFDHAFNRAWDLRLRITGVEPRPAQQDRRHTRTIDYAIVRRNRLPWFCRGSTLLFRAGNSIARLRHGLWIGLQRQLQTHRRPTTPPARRDRSWLRCKAR